MNNYFSRRFALVVVGILSATTLPVLATLHPFIPGINSELISHAESVIRSTRQHYNPDSPRFFRMLQAAHTLPTTPVTVPHPSIHRAASAYASGRVEGGIPIGTSQALVRNIPEDAFTSAIESAFYSYEHSRTSVMAAAVEGARQAILAIEKAQPENELAKNAANRVRSQRQGDDKQRLDNANALWIEDSWVLRESPEAREVLTDDQIRQLIQAQLANRLRAQDKFVVDMAIAFALAIEHKRPETKLQSYVRKLSTYLDNVFKTRFKPWESTRHLANLPDFYS